MTRRRLAIAVIMIALVLSFLALLTSMSYHRQRAVAELRYVGSGQVNIEGHIYFGSTFWVSNSSDTSIMISLRAIETNASQGWSIYSNTIRTVQTLSPYQAGCFSIDPPRTDGTWRLRV